MESWPEWGKPYQPGLFIILPPQEVRAIVDAQREAYDPLSRSYIGTHITVTQPFLRTPTESEWEQCVEVLGSFQSFEICYGPLKSFLPYPCIWYEVQPAELVLELRRTLHQTGLFNLKEGYIEEFIPHMTITEGLSGPEVTQALLAQLQSESQPGSFLCDQLVLSVPDQDFRFSPFRTISLI